MFCPLLLPILLAPLDGVSSLGPTVNYVQRALGQMEQHAMYALSEPQEPNLAELRVPLAHPVPTVRVVLQLARMLQQDITHQEEQ